MFLAVATVAMRLLRAESRNNPTRYRKLGPQLYEAVDRRGRSVYFYNRSRFPRYAGSEGVETIFEYLMSQYLRRELHLDATSTVVEVGGNVGEFTVPVARVAKRVVTFEPDPTARAILGLNCRDSSNVTVLPFAASDHSGEQPFFVASEEADSSLIRPTGSFSVGTAWGVRLDDLLDLMELSSVDLLKVEAEGAEPEVLMGAERTLRITRQVTVDCSPERHGESTFAQVRQILEDAGFVCTESGIIMTARRAHSI